MKITRLSISQILGIREFDLRPSKPVVVLTAGNHQGKTSIVNALSLAMEHRLPRIDKQKDAVAILNDGAKAGTVDVFTDTYKEPFLANVTDGKIIRTHGEFRYVQDALLEILAKHGITADVLAAHGIL